MKGGGGGGQKNIHHQLGHSHSLNLEKTVIIAISRLLSITARGTRLVIYRYHLSFVVCIHGHTNNAIYRARIRSP